MILRCTVKMLDLLGARSGTLTEAPTADDDWYLNLVWIDGRKCVLLTHAGTLFSVFRVGVRKAELKSIGTYVVNAISEELRLEALPANTFGPLDPTEVQLAKTASRTTLGFMTQIAFELKWWIADARTLDDLDVRDLNHQLRRTLHNHGGYAHPIDLVTQHLAARNTL